ncbi:ribonuclease P protein component 2 [Candidatus Woesearchaeota archaeon]|nr:ribonuclease P protein component 2 [Candidatus Woesearchaeota archaeon]
MKPIPPTLREKKRYVAFEIATDVEMQEKMIKKAVNEAVIRFVGELGMAKAGLRFIEVKKNKALVMVNHKELDNVKAALTLIKEIDNHNALIKTLGVSGILKKAKNKFMGG